jgi:Spy/CpxP family protein refolding chaperone
MKMLLIFLSLILFAITSSAQVERKPVNINKTDTVQAAETGNKADKQSRRDRMKELDLTREQRIKMKELMQANKVARASIENNPQLSEPEKKKQLRELQRQQAQKIQAILTPEQLAKFKAGGQND